MATLCTSFVISFIATLLIVRFQHLHSHVTADFDLNGVQKFHAIPVPRVGGIGVMIGLSCGQLAAFFLESDIAIFGLLLVVSAFPAFIFGLIEDLTKCVSVRKRLMATALSAVVGGILLGGWLSRLDILGVDFLMTFRIIAVLVTCFTVAGVANAFNLIDGYNGLASMVAVIILSGLSYVAHQVGDQDIFIAALASIGGVLGFLLFNYPRGLIFLGDGGAYLIGFLVAELSVLLAVRNPEVSPWFPFLLVFYPIFETIFTIFRRVVIAKKHPGLPDAAHMHQLIYRRVVCRMVTDDCSNKTNKQNAMTSPFLWLMAAITVIPAILFWKSTIILQFYCLFFAIVYSLIYRVLYKGRFLKWLSIRRKG